MESFEAWYEEQKIKQMKDYMDEIPKLDLQGLTGKQATKKKLCYEFSKYFTDFMDPNIHYIRSQGRRIAHSGNMGWIKQEMDNYCENKTKKECKENMEEQEDFFYTINKDKMERKVIRKFLLSWFKTLD